MTSKVRYKVIYNRAKRLDQAGTAAVVIESYQNGVRRYFSTGLRLKPAEWDKRTNEVKGNPDYNRLIRTRLNELEKFELLFPTQYERSFTLKDFDLLPEKQVVNETPIPLSFTKFLSQQIEEDKGTITRATYTRYVLVNNMLTKFNEGKPIAFEQLTYPFIENYNRHLRKIHNYKPNTIVNQHKVINRFLIKAARLSLIDNHKNPYHEFKYKKEPTNKIALDLNEIRRIEELTFSKENEHLIFYRDIFLLAYYTLLRISDITSIRQKHIIEEAGRLELKITAKKTKKTDRIPLHNLHQTAIGISKPEQIIRQYSRNDGAPLFQRAHQNINYNLKKVFRLAGISQPATFHTARHSGITFLVTVLPIPFVQELAQHSDVKTTMIYVHLSKLMVKKALDEVCWFK